jgi:starch synthase
MTEKLPKSYRFNPGDKSDSLDGKKLCKQDFISKLTEDCPWPGVEQFGFLESYGDGPLFTFIGRLSGQKGVDVLLEVLPVFLKQNSEVKVAILGSGEAGIESSLIHLAGKESFPGRVCYLKGYNPQVADEVYCAGDYFVIPSRFEPCGLTDFIAQLYGNIPIVHHVGGLVKVVDGETGLAYRGSDPGELLHALSRAMVLEKDPFRKRSIQENAVATIEKKYTWSKVMYSYLELYARSYVRQLQSLNVSP